MTGRRITASALLLLLFTGSLYVAVRQLHLFRLTEAGYGDSYILYDVQHFQKTGEIYRNLSQPPYLPAQYGPLVYMLYALPSRLPFENPFLGPRLVALTFFFACVAMVALIVRALIPTRHAWQWGLLMATSITSLETWPLQIRGDYPGILLSLAAIRLLLLRSKRAVLLAGLCAGLAVQFKMTYVAALAAGMLWLLLEMRWRELVIFGAAGACTSAGLLTIFWLREPRMISQMAALAPGIKDIPGCIFLGLKAIREPVILLALPALPLAMSRRWPRWNLVLLYALASFGIAGVTDIQAGGNINYFHEGLLAIIPLSVLGAFRLIRWSRQMPVAVFVTGLILTQVWLSEARDLYELRSQANPRIIKAQNDLFRGTEAALRGERILSTIPRMALLDPHPTLMEPFLLSYMQRLGKVDPKPILDRIRNEEFDVVITSEHRDSYRGVTKVGPDLGGAIVGAYRPHCVLRLEGPLLLFLPRNRPEDSVLTQKLQALGCVPYSEPANAF